MRVGVLQKFFFFYSGSDGSVAGSQPTESAVHLRHDSRISDVRNGDTVGLHIGRLDAHGLGIVADYVDGEMTDGVLSYMNHGDDSSEVRVVRQNTDNEEAPTEDVTEATAAVVGLQTGGNDNFSALNTSGFMVGVGGVVSGGAAKGAFDKVGTNDVHGFESVGVEFNEVDSQFRQQQGWAGLVPRKNRRVQPSPTASGEGVDSRNNDGDRSKVLPSVSRVGELGTGVIVRGGRVYGLVGREHALSGTTRSVDEQDHLSNNPDLSGVHNMSKKRRVDSTVESMGSKTGVAGSCEKDTRLSVLEGASEVRRVSVRSDLTQGVRERMKREVRMSKRGFGRPGVTWSYRVEKGAKPRRGPVCEDADHLCLLLWEQCRRSWSEMVCLSKREEPHLTGRVTGSLPAIPLVRQRPLSETRGTRGRGRGRRQSGFGKEQIRISGRFGGRVGVAETVGGVGGLGGEEDSVSNEGAGWEDYALRQTVKANTQSWLFVPLLMEAFDLPVPPMYANVRPVGWSKVVGLYRSMIKRDRLQSKDFLTATGTYFVPASQTRLIGMHPAGSEIRKWLNDITVKRSATAPIPVPP